jgi:glycosyltransferase involved in cell wall biosynthesis
MKKSRNVFYRFLSEFSYGNWVTEDWEREVSFVCHSGIVSDDYSFSSSSENYWLWVGGLRWGMKAKGLDLTMDLARKCPNQEIRVYGGGNPALENELNLHSQKYSNFRYLGELKRGSDHKEAFSKAKLFLMPTAIPDTFPRVVLESMSKGTPVLGSNFGSIPEMVGEKGGSIFDPFISEKDISIAESRDRKEVFDWSQKFSIEKEVEKLKDVSLKILQNRKLF